MSVLDDRLTGGFCTTPATATLVKGVFRVVDGCRVVVVEMGAAIGTALMRTAVGVLVVFGDRAARTDDDRVSASARTAASSRSMLKARATVSSGSMKRRAEKKRHLGAFGVPSSASGRFFSTL